MDAKKALAQFREEFDPVLREYLDARIDDMRKRDTFTAEGLSRCAEIILSGGKRLRPALTVWSYRGMGGTDINAIMHAAMSVELIHAFLLIHDDIMDRDIMRHNTTTLHESYRKKLAPFIGKSEAIHAGNSIAIVFGDMINALGNHALFSAPFESNRIFEALTHLQDVIGYTCMGQLKDVMFEYGSRASTEDILKMYEYKTAQYTIESPLILGAILADAPKGFQEKIHTFARPIGTAFQIRDDIIGLFGNMDAIGKPVGSDIQEGKITLLVALAREMASQSEQSQLNALLEKKNISKSDVDTFRKIIVKSGAQEKAENLVQELTQKGRVALEALPYHNATKDTLISLTKYLTERPV